MLAAQDAVMIPHESRLGRPPESSTKFAEESTLFRSFDATLPPLKPLGDEVNYQTPFATDFGHKDRSLSPAKSASRHYEATPHSPAGAESDIQCVWTAQSLEEGEAGALHTWEALETLVGQSTSSYRHTALSEAGAGAYDAALCVRGALKGHPVSDGVLPWTTVVHSLRSLILGRASVLFPWLYKEQKFVASLPEVAISGFSIECTQSVISHILSYGTTFRRLRDAIGQRDSTAAWSDCATITAFRRCVGWILDATEAALSERLDHISTILGLYGLTLAPNSLLSNLDHVLAKLDVVARDEEAIAICAEHQIALSTYEDRFARLFTSVFAEVCAPWLQSFAKGLTLAKLPGPWLTSDPTIIPRSRVDSLGGPSCSQSTGGLHSTNILDDLDRALIDDVRVSLEILRTYSLEGVDQRVPRAQLALPAPNSNTKPETEAELWQQTSDMGVVLDPRMELTPIRKIGLCEHRLSRLTTDALGFTESIESSLSESLGRFRADPFADIRVALYEQAADLNMRVAKCLFETHNLKEHLQVQWDYHLLGNGEFVSQMIAALFSADAQSTERRRGVIPTSNALGLRLDTHHDRSWPPASSELRLTLMGILGETYQKVNSSTRLAGDAHKEMPGGLSFAIRELSDAEIDRVMDPESIYALDFLRLQYTAPAPLDVIITPESTQHYDDIFRFLLRLLRINHVAANLRATMLKGFAHQRSPALCRTSFEAHRVSSVLMSHFMELGIRNAWGDFMQQINEALVATKNADPQRNSASSRVCSLRVCHDRCLSAIRERLFLRHKQQDVRLAIEGVFTAILQLAYACTPTSETQAIASFKATTSQLSDGLRDLSRKLDSKASGASLLSMVDILRSRLVWHRS